MMQNQQEQMHQNMHTGTIPPQLNHGGHEIMDVQEVLSGTVSTMDQYMMFSQFVKDPELRDIINRQYQFMQNEYNITLECFQSGQDPSMRTQRYKMKQDNDFVYGLKNSQPKRPMQSMMEISDEFISGCMLSAAKASATMKTMAALESTNPVVRRVLADSVPNCCEMAYELAIYQNKHHYYQVPQLPQQDMMQMQNAFAPAQGMPQMQQGMNQGQGMMQMNNTLAPGQGMGQIRM